MQSKFIRLMQSYKRENCTIRFYECSGSTGDFALEGPNGAMGDVTVVGIHQQL